MGQHPGQLPPCPEEADPVLDQAAPGSQTPDSREVEKGRRPCYSLLGSVLKGHL